MTTETAEKPKHFIRQIIDEDLKTGKHASIATRFPPEPNGFLHVGHAKSICLNFGLAGEYQGSCNLRFDDTNPAKEEQAYADAIEADVRWLGFEWNGEVRHASDYFEQLYTYAIELIEKGLAYVDDLPADKMREYRGTLTEPGKNSPSRERSVEDNLDLFKRMRAGEFDDGAYILRAKIDMTSPNMNMRDPVLYRIKRQHHHRTGDDWCIYPTYDYTHCISDAIEGITHSLCTLEFEDHRPLYDWVVANISIETRPQQIEFSRLNLEHTVTSKRKLNQLVTDNHVSGWDDPRMPTISAMRRRGYTPASIREFCERVGITKKNHTIEMSSLESCVRDDLDKSAARVMAVLKPLKIVITNYPEDKVEELSAPNHPQKPEMGERTLFFTREAYIDQEDFRESANKHFKRLVLGKEVRLRNAYVIRCDEVIKDEDENIVELRCSYDPETLGKNPEDRKVKGVIHWVSASHSLPAEVRLYDRLFNVENPGAEDDLVSTLNPESLNVLTEARIEMSVKEVAPETRFQFEREGYFCSDRIDCVDGKLVFNRTVTLRDSWAKVEKKGG
ncbi:glutamine--tRNA ligase/YqeY domain fusion protein [Pleionea sp. CnH1-48]|uniref:glutamine--tRNA ligase/YqeY domain fusion protein n=1 Tax=Pleionea sp. CnH1-48 TaxID=2954494 RepID=UPI00209773C4|nr:glutamine--tRNA ligase/YqeY domain fusion protein [Pleionea sp. CnH1-48]MCO7226692.1 glutamine--tRNA ligase/YqeY domain fusion protein [Pleionea sp. CnH1-48]